MQQLTCKMICFFLFILFEKSLHLKKSPGGKKSEKYGKVWKSVNVEKCECEKVPKRFCSLVVAL